MDADKLQRLGLNRNEAKIYLALLEIGEAQAGRLSKKTQINRTTTYDSLERLLEKGLISYSLQAGRKVFQASSPEKLMENIKEQEHAAGEIIPELQQIYRSFKIKEESHMHQGRKGIKSILHDILKCKEYIAFGSSGRFLEIMKHDFLAFQRRKKEQSIKARVILNKSARKSETVSFAYTQFRYIPDSYATPTSTFVYGDYSAIIIWGENPVAIVINSRAVAKSHRSYFELLWKLARR